jgi:hypothetical protein
LEITKRSKNNYLNYRYSWIRCTRSY